MHVGVCGARSGEGWQFGVLLIRGAWGIGFSTARYLPAARSGKDLKRGELEQHDGFAVPDFAGADLAQGFVEGKLDDLDVFFLDTATFGDALGMGVFGDEEVKHFGD